MTGKEFQTWMRGFMEGVRSLEVDDIDFSKIVERIEKEANKIDAAPLIDLERILRETPKPEPWPGMPSPWKIEPYRVPQPIEPYRVPFVQNDCGCDPNSVCGNSACPRAIRFNGLFTTSAHVLQ